MYINISIQFFYSKISSLQEELDQAQENLHNFVSEHEKIEKELVIRFYNSNFLFMRLHVSLNLAYLYVVYVLYVGKCLTMLGQQLFMFKHVKVFAGKSKVFYGRCNLWFDYQ